MKTSFAKVASGLALMAVSSVAMASVVNTAHNLGSTNQTGGNYNSGTTEICIFCHTPHGGDQGTFAPLWNRARNTSTYTRFSTLNRLTFDAKEAPIGAVSAACLSCHDGTQGMDAVINSPGSNTTGTAGGNTNWTEASTTGTMADLSPADGSWDGSVGPSGTTRGDMIYLGTDLTNDHPISMQYGGGGITSLALTAQTNDPDFAQAVGATLYDSSVLATNSGEAGGTIANGGSGNPSHAGLGATTPTNTNNINGSGGSITGVAGSGTGTVEHDVTVNGDRWWVETGGNNAFESNDFPLYTRTDVTTSPTAQPTVECGTCHDPHSGNPTFLRLVGGNNGSAVCLTCHAK